jgi:hypothetical protein
MLALLLAALPDFGVAAARLNGAWIPSMAEELATEVSTMRRRMTGSRRYGLAAESLELILQV